MPVDAPKDITPAQEVFGVHTYADIHKYMGDEVIIFRNFTDCASTFDNEIFPLHKDQVDTYTKISYLEESPGNAYRPGVTKGEHVDRSLKDILDRKDPNEFASFLKIFDGDDYRKLLNALPEDKFKFDSSFISHFDRPIVSTGIHAAPVAQTLSIQCYGTKSWLFWKAEDLDKHGVFTVASPQGQVMTGDHESIVKIPTKVAKVYPNDLMYFPPLYYHAVSTKPGKNVMFAIRKIDMASSFQSLRGSFHLTLCWLLRYAHTTYYNKSGKVGFHETRVWPPFKAAIFEEVVNKQFDAFKEVDGLADFQLL